MPIMVFIAWKYTRQRTGDGPPELLDEFCNLHLIWEAHEPRDQPVIEAGGGQTVPDFLYGVSKYLFGEADFLAKKLSCYL